MRNPGAARWIGIVAGTAILLAGVAAAARWTLIPLRIDARVVDVGYEDSTTGHLRTLTLDDGRTLVIDRGFLTAAGERKALTGATLRKGSWQRHVDVNGHRVPLPIPTDVWLTLAALAVPVVAGWWLRGTARRSAGTG